MVTTFLAEKRGRNVGNTGAPGETDEVTCLNCHVRGSFRPNINIDLIDKSNKKIEKILPNTDYTVNIQLLDKVKSTRF